MSARAGAGHAGVSRRTTAVRLLVVRGARPVREIRVRPRRWLRAGAAGVVLLWGLPIAALAAVAAQARGERAAIARDAGALAARTAELSAKVTGLERMAGVAAAPAPDAPPNALAAAPAVTLALDPLGPPAAALPPAAGSWFADLEHRLEAVRGALRARLARLRSTPSGVPVAARQSSGFGWRANPFTGAGAEWHKGLDFPSPVGTPVRATADGVVEYAERRSGYGLAVHVRHADGYSTLFGHLSAAAVRAGQRVGRGDVVGRVGNEGRSTGPHVHYEVRRWGKPMDPRRVSPPASSPLPLAAPFLTDSTAS